MHRKLCLIHANCQGDELERLLLASGPFRRKYRVIRRTNYTHEPISAEEIGSCEAFLYQHLEPRWGELASDALIKRLPASALSVRLPNLFTKSYWPMWTKKSPVEEFGDSLLDRLIDEGAPKAAILRIYLHGDIDSLVNLDAVLEETLAIEREKESASPVKIVDHFLRHWKRRMLFHTTNHPGTELLELAAAQILEAMNMPPLTDEETAGLRREVLFPSYANFDQPIHPRVAAHFGLDFAGPDTEYAVFGRRMTFAQYVSRYIDCRLNGMQDSFLGYLQLV